MAKILIIGAGPTGLTLGCFLLREGHSVTILEKDEVPSNITRALMVHAASLEVFEHLGIVEQLLSIGIVQHKITFDVRYPSAERYSLDFSKLEDTRYNFFINLSQPKLEAILAKTYQERGGCLIRGAALLNFDDTTGHTQYKHQLSDALIETTCDYLIGCDGASSTVRKLADIEFAGTTYPFQYLLAEGSLAKDRNRGESSIIITNNLVLSVLPIENGEFRIAGPGRMNKSNTCTTEAAFNSMLKDTQLSELAISKFSSLRNYTVNERVAEHFVKGRVILCGDAAHIHSPTGGQAMNLGIADAFNLHWRFNNSDTPVSLKIYERERKVIAEEVIAFTNMLGVFNQIKDGTLDKSKISATLHSHAKIFSQLYHNPYAESKLNCGTLAVGTRVSTNVRPVNGNSPPNGQTTFSTREMRTSSSATSTWINVPNAKISVRPDWVVDAILK